MTASELSEQIAYLKTLPAIRERALKVYAKAKTNTLDHFHVNLSRLDAVAALVKALIDRDYSSPKDVPGHSRWRHFDVGGVPRVQNLLNDWSAKGVDKTEQARRTIDLFVVSVLLDAGAGSAWSYTEKSSGTTFARSEGLAIASLEMFLSGAFSSDKVNEPHRVDAVALSALTPDELGKGFQSDGQTNPLVALEGRCQLLNRLGTALSEGTEWFGGNNTKCARPGNLVDYLLKHPLTSKSQDSGTITIQLSSLWPAIISGFAPVWPATRTRLGGVALGDVWPLYHPAHCSSPSSLSGSLNPDKLVPFHKLSQWLTYSLLDALTHTLSDIHVSGTSDLTGLPEYRNGGLLIDMGVLVLKEADRERGLVRARNELDKAQDRNWGECPPACEVVPVFEVWDPVVVEWRACTVAMLDEIAEKVGTLIGRQIELAKVLEGGTWKAGRELAAKLRPISKGPPIGIVSDGTVF